MFPFQSRAEFWQQQKPMYARKGKSAKQDAKRDKGDPAKYILKCLEDIDEGVKILTRLRARSHLATATQIFDVVSMSSVMGYIVTNVTVHT